MNGVSSPRKGQTLKFFEWSYGEVPVPNLLTIGALTIGLAAGAGLLWAWLGNVVIVVMLALVLGLLAVQQATIYYTHHQIEALHSIHRLIDLRAPLPAFRSWNITPDLAAVITGLILERKPQLVVEVGGGLSSIVAGYLAEKQGGRIVAFDHLAEFAGKTADTIAQHGLDGVVEIRHAPLTPVKLGGQTWQWYDLAQFEDLHGIDLLFIDGPPNTTQAMARYPALPLLFDRLSENAVIVLDDAGRVAEKRAVARWLEEFPTLSAERLITKRGSVVLRRETASPAGAMPVPGLPPRRRREG